MRIWTLRTGAAALAAAAALAGAVAPSAQASQAKPGGTYEGCELGYVCLYPGQTWNGGHPSQTWKAYGYHNLKDVKGFHYLVDNQTSRAWDFECTGYGGTGQARTAGRAFYDTDVDLTQIGSVKLEPSKSEGCTG